MRIIVRKSRKRRLREQAEMTEKKEKRNKIVMISLFVLYAVWNGLLLALHEPWRDEANVWLMAGELSPIELLREIKYQGHPCLWYFLVMPFAKLGFPFRTIEVLSFLIMLVTAFFLLWKLPVSSLTKGICLFSPVFTYFYPVIARNYCLIALLLLLLLWQYPKRNERSVLYGLLLGLLVQADTIAIAEAGMISLMWLLEALYEGIRRKSWLKCRQVLSGIWIPALSLGLWVLQFYQVSDSPQYQMRELGFRELIREVWIFACGIFTRIAGWEQPFICLFLLLGLGLLLFLSIRLKNLWALGILGSTFLFQAAFSALVYQLHIWHYISLCFVFLFVLGILRLQMGERDADKLPEKLAVGGLELLFCILCVGMLFHWNSDKETSSLEQALHGTYSDAENAAAYVRTNLAPEELIVSADVPMASTVLAYLPGYDFYFAGNGKRQTYADWSREQSRTVSLEELILWVEEAFPEKEGFYLLWTEDSKIEEAEALESCEVLYKTREQTVRGEEFTLYRVLLTDQPD